MIKDFKEVSKKYDFPDNAQLLKSSLNLIYGAGNRIFQFTPKKYKTEDELQLEVNWISYLNNNNFEVVKVIPSHQGKLVESITDFSVICYEKILGKKANPKNWNTDYFTNLGAFVGRLHNLGKSFEINNKLSIKNWRELPKSQFVNFLPSDDRELKRLYEFLMNKFSTYEVNEHNHGIVHYDIHYENYFLRGEAQDIILFDFEMTCASWHINDIAIILYYILNSIKPQDHQALTHIFMKSFFEGYRGERSIDEDELSKIPSFLMYRDLLVYGFTFRIWNNENEMDENARRFRNRLQISIDKRMKEFAFR